MISTIILNVVIALVCCLILGAALFFGTKVLSRQQSSGAAGQIEEIDKKISVINSSIDNAIKKFEHLVSADELEQLDSAKDQLNKTLQEVQSKLHNLENALASKQKEVDAAESSHNDLKRSKEAAAVLADDLKATKAKLESEHKALETELNQSLSQLQALSSELHINPQAEAGINKIKNSLSNSQIQLKTLIQIYQQGSTRFVNLQEQYKDLEKEFTKLVEKELSG